MDRGLAGTGVLAIWSDADPEHEDEFNHWYTSQHLPERVGVPGFRRGRRYVKDGPGELRYLTIYETADLAVLESAAYLERLNHPTDWTRRVLPFFRNGSRLAMRVTSTDGAGIGGLAATIRFGPHDGCEPDLRSWAVAARDQVRQACPDLTGWHLCELDDQVTGAKSGTEEARAGQRPAAARPPAAAVAPSARPWMLMIESTGSGAIGTARDLLAGTAGLSAHGAASVGDLHAYRLMIALTSPQ